MGGKRHVGSVGCINSENRHVSNVSAWAHISGGHHFLGKGQVFLNNHTLQTCYTIKFQLKYSFNVSSIML